jgi:uncharacterized delta-60 repeat protein
MRLPRIVAPHTVLLLIAKLVAAAISLLVDPTPAMGQLGTALWTNRYNEAGGYLRANAVGLDNQGNVFVTGHSGYYGINQHYTTIKYSSAGVPLWTNYYFGRDYPWYDLATTLVVDGAGNVIVSGYSAKSGGHYDYATIKYSSVGQPLWTNRYDGPGRNEDQATAITIDASNNIIVTGYSARNSSPPYNYDFATIKYSSAGTPLWTNRYDGPGNIDDKAKAVVVDANGNVLVTGSSALASGNFALIKYSNAGLPLWTNCTGAWNSVGLAVDTNGNAFLTGAVWNGTNHDYATSAYSSTGVPLWTNYYNGTGNGSDLSASITVDRTGNVIVTGVSVSGGNNLDYLTIAYSNEGVPLWTNHFGNELSDAPSALALDVRDKVFVTGYSANTNGSVDLAIVALSRIGVPLWTNRYSQPNSYANHAHGIAVDGAGNVCVTGYSEGELGDEFVTIKYSGDTWNVPVTLAIQITGNQAVLSWTNAAFSLQSAPTVHGYYTNVAGATSPFTNLITGNQQYFRLRSN